VLFTLRPTVDNITGSIKALFPTRIALRCVSKLESRIILDIDGAELLENVAGRALMLNNAKYEKIQIMNYNLSDEVCEEHNG
jgi:DNA segregation ATPase FtsK/SpoIIIE-like protein